MTDEPARVARLHDGTEIAVSVVGSGPAVLLPVRTNRYPADLAETMRQWGGDPDYGPTLVEGLSGSFTVVAADYEGHRLTHFAPDSLTPTNVATDLLAITDAAGADRFAYYGYSWLAMAGLQLAVRTDRLTGLAMGGYPPWDGPYAEMLAVTRAAHAMAAASVVASAEDAPEVEPGDWDNLRLQVDPAQTQQFVTLYEGLADFDDRVSLELTLPRLCFVGAEDTIVYGPQWGGVRVSMAVPVRDRQAELEAAGWTVRLLPGLDHSTAMHGPVVLGILESTLTGWLLPAR